MKRKFAGLAALAIGSLVAAGLGTPAQAAPPQPVSPTSYAALGDSFAVVAQPSYPFVLAGGLNVNFQAALGATTDDIDDQASAILPTTQQVTLTVGGNDLGFTAKAKACAADVRACALSDAEVGALQELPTKLAAAIEAIREQAPHAKVYVTGYPLLFQASGPTCVVGTFNGYPFAMESTRTDQLDAAATALNRAIKASIVGKANSYAKYVDVSAAFDGHGVCGTTTANPDSWIIPVTATWDGAGKVNFNEHLAPLHPTTDGQVAYASAIKAKGFKG